MSEPSTATHTVWCGTDHDPAENGCLTEQVRFPALGVTTWVADTAGGPRGVIDPSGTIVMTLDEMAAFGAWLIEQARRPAAGEV
jgi:hypothetical protein